MTGWLHACSRCRRGFLLLAHTVLGMLCAECWRALGEPSAPLATNKERYEQEQETRERMLAHGGTSRHLVRKGIS